MLSFTSSQQYYLSIGCVDMRKGCDGLSGVVRQGLGRNQLSGEVYIFLNRRRTHLKRIPPSNPLWPFPIVWVGADEYGPL